MRLCAAVVTNAKFPVWVNLITNRIDCLFKIFLWRVVHRHEEADLWPISKLPDAVANDIRNCAVLFMNAHPALVCIPGNCRGTDTIKPLFSEQQFGSCAQEAMFSISISKARRSLGQQGRRCMKGPIGPRASLRTRRE